MLSQLGLKSINALIDKTIPKTIQTKFGLHIGQGLDEFSLLKKIKEIASKNIVARSYIGMGYYGTITPPVIQRNILENPGWYTAYTPYQAEISQGRLEALVNFQTMVTDMTGLDIANSSLLDEATAAAEAMIMLFHSAQKRNRFLVAENCHPQTIDVLKTRANPIGIELSIQSTDTFDFSDDVFGALIQYPATDGKVVNYSDLCQKAHDQGVAIAMATDLLSLALLPSSGDMGADVAIGSSQRFGVPMGFGGPHAAFIAAKEKYKRKMPGRIIGVSVDRHGNLAYRMALQTREQHIRRDRATSNICTSQVLLAVMAGMYAVYHGAEGIRAIAKRIHGKTKDLATALSAGGYHIVHDQFFDTIRIGLNNIPGDEIKNRAELSNMNFRYYDNGDVGIALDETVSPGDLSDILTVFKTEKSSRTNGFDLQDTRANNFLTHSVFSNYHTETEMMRYLHRLETKDLTLNTSMISLGSCTMKLNAAAEMMPITWPEFAHLHPFAPADQTQGYSALAKTLSDWLMDMTGLQGCSLQPNSGAQGEYAGLLIIRAFHLDNGNNHRNICLIPASAHGTNPASAVMCGMKVVVVECDDNGNIDVKDLKAKAEQHQETLAAIMVTYPSTHGVFEEAIGDICNIVHDNGGQVYLDGANLNAMVGLARIGEFGADVCHINLHKTFAIPHGGGGPGMGPIGVAEHLVDFLPDHSVVKLGGENPIGTISAAPWGSASILPISWMYIAMMGPDGLRAATEHAILNANYIAHRLDPHYPVLFKGANGHVAHECILDLRQFKKVTVEDVAKRLMDYGFHAPTISWPVAGTMMVEPTESESKEEMDRFCDAMIAIHAEIEAIESGEADAVDNLLKQSPHTPDMVAANDWPHAYGREQAAFPAEWLREYKHWPATARIDNVWGDRNLVCSCTGMEAFLEE